MSYREQIRRMRRQFHKDITVLRDEQERIEARLNTHWQRNEARLGKIDENLRLLNDQVGDLYQQVGGLHEQVGRLSLTTTSIIEHFDALVAETREGGNEIMDLNRTLTGRMRLMEERMGIFMDVLETQNDSMEQRIRRLEERDHPAA